VRLSLLHPSLNASHTSASLSAEQHLEPQNPNRIQFTKFIVDNGSVPHLPGGWDPPQHQTAESRGERGSCIVM
jgi:hypothetical protein